MASEDDEERLEEKDNMETVRLNVPYSLMTETELVLQGPARQSEEFFCI